MFHFLKKKGAFHINIYINEKDWLKKKEENHGFIMPNIFKDLPSLACPVSSFFIFDPAFRVQEKVKEIITLYYKESSSSTLTTLALP